MIGVVDYGLGNVRAFENIYRRLGIDAIAVRDAGGIEACDRLILPGVGAFDWAMERLEISGMKNAICGRVLEDKIPVLGVCVGMQIMADCSEEGRLSGLGWIPGQVRKFRAEWFRSTTHLPHMGWNTVALREGEPLWAGLSNASFYFLHSYYFEPGDESVVATADYGISFAAAVRKDNVWGTQFHPEKSHAWGIALLNNFATV